jgi:hypothetical protein
MQIQINAAARLNKAQQVHAATAADAGKVVLWIQKAIPGIKGKKRGKAGKQEGMEFKAGSGKNAIMLGVLLDHQYDPPRLLLVGNGPSFSWSSEKKTGRQTILDFKNQMRETLSDLQSEEGNEKLIDTIKALIKAKAKIETE